MSKNPFLGLGFNSWTEKFSRATTTSRATTQLSDFNYTITNSGTTFTLRSTGTVDYTVDWGDGSSLANQTSTALAHTYASADTYVIKVNSNSGAYRPRFNNSGDEDQITSIAIGTSDPAVIGTELTNAFNGAVNLTQYTQPFSATSAVTDFERTWNNCPGLTSFPLINTSSGTIFTYTWMSCSGLTAFPLLNFSSATSVFGTWSGCSGITTFPTIDTSSSTSFGSAWNGCSGLTTFPQIDTSSGTNFKTTWSGCSGLTTFPVLDTSSGTNFRDAWKSCSGLTSFPALDFSNVTNIFTRTWNGCSGITTFPSINVSNCPGFNDTWSGCTSLTTFPANQFDSTGTLISTAFNNAWYNCALTAQSIENILTSLDTNGASNITLGIDGGTNADASTWSYDALTSYINLHNKGWTISKNGDATDISYKITIASDGDSFNLKSHATSDYDVDWGDGSSDTNQTSTISHTYTSAGTYVVKVTVNSGTYRPYYNYGTIGSQITEIAIGDSVFPLTVEKAFTGCTNVIKYNQISSATSAVTNFKSAFSSFDLTSFPLIDVSSGTNFGGAWSTNINLTTFPVLDVSNGTNFSYTWKGCTEITTFPVLDFSSGTDFTNAWSYCDLLTSFPALPTSNRWINATTFKSAWVHNDSLTTFPANMFDTTGSLVSDAFDNTWRYCSLTAQSIENILTSLDTNGASSITLTMSGGTNANASTWSYDALTSYINLYNKGWTITKNGDATDISYKITIASDGDTFTLRSYGAVNYTVDWGDGNSETSTSFTLAHTYATAGTYVIKVNHNSGTYRPIFNNSGDEDQITSIAIGTDDSAVMGNNLRWAFKGANNMTEYNQVSSATSAVTNFMETWSDCTSLTSFPLIDTSSGISFALAWYGCSGLTSFVELDFSSAISFWNAWPGCASLTTFPANVFDTTGTLDSNAFQNAFYSCALTAQSIENILTSLDTNGQSNITLAISGGTNANASTWSYDALTSYIKLHNKGWTITKNGDATDISYKITIASDGDTFTLRSTGTVDYDVDWGDGSAVQTVTSSDANANDFPHTYSSSGTYVVKINSNSGAYRPYFYSSGDEDQITSIAIGTDDSAVLGTTNIKRAFRGANNMTEYNQVSSATSTVGNFEEAWMNCSSLTSFPLIDTSGANKFTKAWRACPSLTSFPLINTSNVSNFYGAWQSCSGLTSFPLIDTSSAITFNVTWNGCSSLTSFPALDFANVNTFFQSWMNCTSLTTFPANMFDTTGTLNSNAFTQAWKNCALTAQSIENILTSLDTNGASNLTLGIDAGTNASKTTWSTAANTAYTNLITKGWTISYNS